MKTLTISREDLKPESQDKVNQAIKKEDFKPEVQAQFDNHDWVVFDDHLAECKGFLKGP